MENDFKIVENKLYHKDTVESIKLDIVSFIEQAEYHPLLNDEMSTQLQQMKRWLEYEYFIKFNS